MTNSQTMHTLPGPSQFPTTRWSLVVAAGDPHRKEARSALVSLCENYWYPLYAYLRRRGYPTDQAQDLTQEFFMRVLEGRYLDRADPEKGRFRSFLLASLNHFLADEWDKARAQKRGGGKVISLDLQSAETRLGEIPVENFTPEKAFEHRWAITLLEQVYQRLGEEYRAEGKGALFNALRTTLAGASDAAPYAELAQQLDMSEGAVKVAVHRLRQRYRGLLRDTIADTVSGPEEVEDELRYLFRTLAG